MPLPFEPLTNPILEAAFEVWQELGPGFLEPVYEAALYIALKDKGLMVERQIPVQVRFRGHLVGTHHIDLLVGQEVALEVKADPSLTLEHSTRMLNHLKASGRPVGIFINFGTPKLEWRRIFNRLGPEAEEGIQEGLS